MRIAIVSNNVATVKVLRTVVNSNPNYEIAWIASNGVEAVEKTAQDKPDLILMDLVLPVIDGSQATHIIMKENPCAILIVTDVVSKNAAKVFEAMGGGALDAENMPIFDSTGNTKGAEELLRKIGTIEKLTSKEKLNPKKKQKEKKGVFKSAQPMIVIGSSTGGPKALAEVISRMPNKLGMPIIIVQHLDVQFANGLVEWLAGQTKLKITLAKADMCPEDDTVFVAGTNDHLVLGPDRTFQYVAEPKNNPYRPSVDAFFLSVVNYWPSKGVAVLLTGMGRDGAQGLLALRKAGWHTIAQDEKTSVVYGMPKAAAEMNAAVEILPIEKIADALIRQIKTIGRLA